MVKKLISGVENMVDNKWKEKVIKFNPQIIPLLPNYNHLKYPLIFPTLPLIHLSTDLIVLINL